MDRKIRQLARKWGTKIRKRSCSGYAFNGKNIALLVDSEVPDPKRRTDSNLIHDIAHYAVCAPERRTLPEFGLGESPDSSKCPPRPKIKLTWNQAQLEEELASTLGIWWERELGLDWRKTFKEHHWDDPILKDPAPKEESKIFDFDATHKFAQRLQELRRRKII